MIYVSDVFADGLLTSPQYIPISEFLSKKIFRLKDTSLTRRQIQTLDKDDLLSKKRKDEKSWRKFSFKELVYLLIVADLKTFGFENAQLRPLWNAFFAEYNPNSKTLIDSKQISDHAICYTFLKAEIIISVQSDGEIGFYDPPHYVVFAREPHIKLVLNDYVKRVYESTGKRMTAPDISLYSEYFKLSEKEEKLLEIIRDEKYSSVEIKKKNGEIELVYAEKQNNELTVNNLIQIIKSKDYQDIHLKQRDGEIVKLNVEETYKFS